MIFLDLHKAYDTMERYKCLDILDGYGVGPRAFRILRTYWGRLKMVARAGGYYRAAFMSSWGVTQVYPLYPIIFNMVVNAVVLHWVYLMVEGTEERGESVQESRHQNSHFCADDVIVASTDPQ